VFVAGLLPFQARAGSPFHLPPPSPAILLNSSSTEALAGVLRGYLVLNVPATLYEKSTGWGHTARVANGVKWTGKVLPIHPHLQYADKNDGDWKRFRFTAANLADTLIFDIRNVQQPKPGQIAFDLFVSFDAKVDFTHQKWDAGVRIYSTSARARLRVKATLGCEVTTELDQKGSLLPDVVFHPKVTRAKLAYDNLVVEHVGGLGGEGAKLIGDALKGGLQKWHPTMESDLLAKGNAAIVKAGELKEVRVNLAKLFGKKPKISPK
jgi:hypothetical protein